MKSCSLQRQLALWALLLVIVPSLLIATIYTVGQIRISRQQSLDMIYQRVTAQEKLIDYWIAERIGDVRNLSRAKAFRVLNEEEMKQILYITQADNQNFDSLSFIDKDGFFRISTLSPGITYPSAQGRPYYQKALEGKEYISDVVIGRNSGQQIINFSSPIYDYNGNFQGLILGSVRTTTLETLLHDNKIGQTGTVFLVNSEGLLLTEPWRLDLLKEKGLVQDTAKMKLKINDDALRNIKLGDSGTATWIDYLGNKVIGAYLYVPERGWTLIGKINEQEILGPIYKQLVLMAGGTVLLILLFLPMATQISNRIKQPIEWLIAQANLVKLEKYEMVVRDKRLENTTQELATLCETFIDMSHKIGTTVTLLKENEDELKIKVVEIQNINAILEEEITERHSVQTALQQINAELETRVFERTGELQQLNNKLQGINEALTVSKKRYRALFDHMQNAFVVRKAILDCYGRPLDLEYIDVNPAYERMYSLNSADIIGRRMTEVFPNIENESFNWIQLLSEVALTGCPVHVEEHFKSANLWIRVEAYSPEKGFVASVIQDITESKHSENQLKQYSNDLTTSNKKLIELNEELQRMSLSDGLTGLANRRYFDEYLERELQRTKRLKAPLALIMLDIDFFKSYNDTYGHLGGDECLKLVSGILKDLPKRNADLVARYGGEEFAIVLPDIDEEGACAVGEKVRVSIEAKQIEHKASTISKYVTVSVGIAVMMPNQDDLATIIISAADTALYRAKQEGRNRVKVAENVLHEIG